MSIVILFNKPFRVLCQFTSPDGKVCLKDFISDAAYEKFYPAGRLDYDSEGLVVLTDDGRMQHRIAHPQHKLRKTYWVQVEGIPTQQQINELANGVLLKDGMTLPASARVMSPPEVPPRNPPIRYRANIPTSWIELIIQEGRNRQVRRMTAAVGLPTLRLIRQSIGPWSIKELPGGHYCTTQVALPSLSAPCPKPTSPMRRRK